MIEFNQVEWKIVDKRSVYLDGWIWYCTSATERDHFLSKSTSNWNGPYWFLFTSRLIARMAYESLSLRNTDWFESKTTTLSPFWRNPFKLEEFEERSLFKAGILKDILWKIARSVHFLRRIKIDSLISTYSVGKLS